MLSGTEASCCVLEKEGEEEAQMDDGVVEKRNEYTHENSLNILRLSEPSELSFLIN
jgi:hypothetical protein